MAVDLLSDAFGRIDVLVEVSRRGWSVGTAELTVQLPRDVPRARSNDPFTPLAS